MITFNINHNIIIIYINYNTISIIITTLFSVMNLLLHRHRQGLTDLFIIVRETDTNNKCYLIIN